MSETLFPVGDKQISAVQDDGTPEGLIKSKIVSGNLVSIPVNRVQMMYQSSNVYSTTTGLNGAFCGFGNTDGSNSQHAYATSAGLATPVAFGCYLVKGRTIGVRFNKSEVSDFSVVIDGTSYAYRVNGAYLNMTSLNGVPQTKKNIEEYWIVAENLTDTMHEVYIVMQPSTVAKRLYLYGFIADSKSGYSPNKPCDLLYGAGTLTASAVPMPVTDNTIGKVCLAIKGVYYNNTDSSPRVISITHDNIVLQKIYLSASGSSGDSYYLDFGSSGVCRGGNTADISHLCDVASKVNFKMKGSF